MLFTFRVLQKAASTCAAAGHGSFKIIKVPGSLKLSKDLDRKGYSNVLQVFDICLELPSDSEKYFCFVLTNFPSLCVLLNRYVHDT